MRLLICLLVSLFASCTRTTHKSQDTVKNVPSLTIEKCLTQQGSYLPNSIVKLSCVLKNNLSGIVNIKSIKIKISNISQSSGVFSETDLANDIALNSGERYAVDNIPVWTIPSDVSKDAYGLYLSYTTEEDNKEKILYATFFRVVDKNTLTTFQIKKNNYGGVNVYSLDGGMSAEYAVEKTLENLGNGISHSWEVNAPGSGPNPVYATPEFLQKSVEQTVKIYNEILGAHSTFETVILSTGIPCVPYVSNVMKAPVLPLHFLVSCNTIKEIQSIMDCSSRNGLKSYATVGYDLSVPPAVAWIKLLDLPDVYLNFLKQHGVKNIVIMGSTGIADGETKAKQVLNRSREKYEPGSIYILYAGNTSDDVTTLSQKLTDYKEVNKQSDYIFISDWESGIIRAQIDNINAALKEHTSIEVYSISSDNLLDLYDLATYTTISFFSKNKLSVKGVAINPYLLSHPAYESWKGFIPMCYWQLNSPQSTFNRLHTTVNDAIHAYFPAINFKALTMWINCSNNFGGERAAKDLIFYLQSNGWNNIKENDYNEDEILNSQNGMNAPCEKIISALTEDHSMFQWNNNLLSLTINDLIDIAKKMKISVVEE